uniref:POU domain protein n=1 Tax=Strongyloides papillosus TaxID=174720 RepID=A0A0N5B2N0_STREA
MNGNNMYDDNDVDNSWFQSLGSQIDRCESKQGANERNIIISNSPNLQKSSFVKESSIEMMPDYLKPYYYPRSPSPIVMFGEITESYHTKSPQHNTNNDVDHHSIGNTVNGNHPMMTYDHYSGMYSTGLISNVTGDTFRFQTEDMEVGDSKISPPEIGDSNIQDTSLWLEREERTDTCKDGTEAEYMEQKVYAELTNVNQDLPKCTEIDNKNNHNIPLPEQLDNPDHLMKIASLDSTTLSYKSSILVKHFNEFTKKLNIQNAYDSHVTNEGLNEIHNFFSHHKAIVLMKSHQEMKNQIALKTGNTFEDKENQLNHPSTHGEEYCNNENLCENYSKDISHENIHLMDLENFASHFKNSRIRYGFTQGDVGHQLGHIFGGEVSQTTISRFEALNLSYKNMIKQKPFLEEWLRITQQLMIEGHTVEDIMKNKLHCKYSIQGRTAEIKNIEVLPFFEEDQKEHLNNKNNLKTIRNPILKRRRKRTNLDITQREYLNRTFCIEPNPDHGKMEEIALDLGLDKEIVRVWFCNKRQKMRKFSLVNGVILSSRMY